MTETTSYLSESESESKFEDQFQEVLAPEKEPLRESARFKVFVNTVVLELFILISGWGSANFGWQIPPELLQAVALLIGGLAVTFITARTYRNTAAK